MSSELDDLACRAIGVMLARLSPEERAAHHRDLLEIVEEAERRILLAGLMVENKTQPKGGRT